MTFPELLATGLGVRLNCGDWKCFWCGASCDESHRVGVSDTFWDWDAVAYPRAKYQCAGCSECLNEQRVMTGRDKPQKTRNFSWLATNSIATPYTKADINFLRELCINPPSAPWGLALAESGQKHILYRTPVNYDADQYSVQLELSRVNYCRRTLLAGLALAARIASKCGKPSLAGPLGPREAMSINDHFLTEEWNRTWNSPVIRLAAFLCPKKEDCDAYVATIGL